MWKPPRQRLHSIMLEQLLPLLHVQQRSVCSSRGSRLVSAVSMMYTAEGRWIEEGVRALQRKEQGKREQESCEPTVIANGVGLAVQVERLKELHPALGLLLPPSALLNGARGVCLPGLLALELGLQWDCPCRCSFSTLTTCITTSLAWRPVPERSSTGFDLPC